MTACCVIGALLFGYLFRFFALLSRRKAGRDTHDWQRPTHPVDGTSP